MEENIFIQHNFSEKKIESNWKTNRRQATEESWTFSTYIDCKAEAKADADAEAEAEAESRSDSGNEIKKYRAFFYSQGTFESL